MAQQVFRKALAGAMAIIAGMAVSAKATAQGCDDPFITAKRTAVGEEPTCIALGDIDGDGDTDAVTGNRRNQNVSVLLNDGVGGMSAVGLVPLTGLPLDVGLADFDGDGHLDIATDDGVALGNGDGTFQPAMPFTMDLGEANELAIADLDADGNLDLVFARREGSVVLPGNGDGTFADAIGVTGDTWCVDVAIADVDADGDLDLLFAAFTEVLVILNDGGAFAPPQAFPTEAARGNTYHLNVGDIDEDGHLDIFATNYNSRTGSVLLGDGTGNFGPPTIIDTVRTNFEVELIDVNADGHLDAITANASGGDIGVLFGDGVGGFGTPRMYKIGRRVVDFALADLDADGVLDIVAGDAEDDALAVLDGSGDGTFAGPQSVVTREAPFATALGDLDGDGKLDVAVAQQGGLAVFVRDESGYASSRGDLTPLREAWRLADMNGDGHPDLVYGDGTPGGATWIWVAINNGDGTFADPVEFRDSRGPIEIAVGDIDGDGDVDVALAHERTDQAVIWHNDGRGELTMGAIYPVGESPGIHELADLDADGDLDLVVPNGRSGDLSVLLNNGDGTFAPEVRSPVADTPRSVAMGDLDGDGDLDALVLHGWPDYASTLLYDGDGRFTDPVAVPRLPRGVAISGGGLADANGDGILDAIVATSDSSLLPSHVYLLAGDGAGGLGEPEQVYIGDEFLDLTIGDTNADGIDDVLVVDTDDSVSIILGQCSLTCRADLDGDGELSIFDFLAFFNAFDAGDPVADFDGDGELTLFDFLAFQDAIDAGCP